MVFKHTAFVGGLCLALLGTSPVIAQDDAPCTASLAAAQAYYVDQDFDVSETLLRECVTRPDVDEETSIQVHRLLTLVYLRQDNRPEAEQVITRLLEDVSFDYIPDPILDPPAYVALVESIKEPLRIEREQALAAQETLPLVDEVSVEEEVSTFQSQAAFRTARTLYVYATLGAGSYGGERGVDGAWWLSEFTNNSGVSLSLGASFSVNRMLDASLDYRLHHIPRLLTLRSADREGEVGAQIDPDASSKSVHLFSLAGRAFYPIQSRLSSYVELGATGSVSRINNNTRVGFGPRAGLGFDIEVTPTLAGFMGFSATLLFPGTAVDHINSQGGQPVQNSNDLLTYAELGVRYRVKTW